MDATRLRECLGLLRWSQRGLAAVLDCHEGLVRKWASARQPVPPTVAEWLEAVTTALRCHPPPTGFRRRSGPPPGCARAPPLSER